MSDLVHDFIFQSARRTPAAEALVYGARRLDYAALADAVTKAAQAFLALDKNTAEGKEILDLQRATRFIPTKAENYKGIEAAARSAGLLK